MIHIFERFMPNFPTNLVDVKATYKKVDNHPCLHASTKEAKSWVKDHTHYFYDVTWRNTSATYIVYRVKGKVNNLVKGSILLDGEKDIDHGLSCKLQLHN